MGTANDARALSLARQAVALEKADRWQFFSLLLSNFYFLIVA